MLAVRHAVARSLQLTVYLAHEPDEAVGTVVVRRSVWNRGFGGHPQTLDGRRARRRESGRWQRWQLWESHRPPAEWLV